MFINFMLATQYLGRGFDDTLWMTPCTLQRIQDDSADALHIYCADIDSYSQ